MKNSHTSFRKSLRRFHNQHRRQYRICREYTVGSVKAVMMSLGLFSFVLGAPGAALAANLPTGGQVVSGVVNINQVDANNMIVTQGSHSAIVNWESFDIGQDAFVNVVQPNVDASMLARVEGINPSEIYGSLSANGHFYLVNPNGILFGENAQINIYSFIASTLDITDTDFLSGNIHFSGDSEASVMNLGTINSEKFAALVAGNVDNQGDIIVPGGDAALLSGDAIIEVGEAAGGKISLDLSGLMGGTASNSGSIDVSSVDSAGGSVAIIGETVAHSGSIDASGATGGGEVLIGGDFQGKNANLSNAQNTVVSGSISADAVENGDGGRVIVWADDVTSFDGVGSARGAGHGAGGFAEVSGKQALSYNGFIDLRSESGNSGLHFTRP